MQQSTLFHGSTRSFWGFEEGKGDKTRYNLLFTQDNWLCPDSILDIQVDFSLQLLPLQESLILKFLFECFTCWERAENWPVWLFAVHEDINKCQWTGHWFQEFYSLLEIAEAAAPLYINLLAIPIWTGIIFSSNPQILCWYVALTSR